MEFKLVNLGVVPLNERYVLFKTLLSWRKSIWQLLWFDLLIYLILYYTISLLYRYVIVYQPEVKLRFDGLILYTQKMAVGLPLTFLLGFFVSTVLGRWWLFVNTIPYMTGPSFLTQSYLVADTDAKLAQVLNLRRRLLRYMNLAWVLQMTRLSYVIKQRFYKEVANTLAPVDGCNSLCSKSENNNCEDLFYNLQEDAGVKETFGTLITEKEIDMFRLRAKKKGVPIEEYEPEYWIPLTWCTATLHEARQLGIIPGNEFYCAMVAMLNSFRGSLGTVSSQNSFNVPLAYIQVILVAVYALFLSLVFSDQFTKPMINVTATMTAEDKLTLFDAYVPIIGLARFMLYMGWFRVGFSLINPLREDQSKFPTDEICTGNMRTAISLGINANNLVPSTPLSDETAYTTNKLNEM